MKPKLKVTVLRLPLTFEPVIKADPAAQLNFSALARSAVDSFLASRTPVIPTRLLTKLLNDKVGDSVWGVPLTRSLLTHYRQAAKALKAKSVNALFINALGHHYGLMPKTEAKARTGSILRAA